MKNKNTENLWAAIKKMGQFSDSYYDKNIEVDMKNELGLNKDESLKELPPEVIFSTINEQIKKIAQYAYATKAKTSSKRMCFAPHW